MTVIPSVSQMSGIQEGKTNGQLWNVKAETSGKIF